MAPTRLLCALCWLGLMLLGRDAWGAPFDLNDTSWEGCSELLAQARKELGDDRVVVRAVLDWQQIQPGDGVLLVHPMRGVDAEEATAFMRAGGRLAVVDDYGRGEELLEHFRIQRRTLPARPLDTLRNKPALPVAVPVGEPAEGRATTQHPTVAQVDRVMLNHGTGLTHPQLTPVLVVRGVGEPDVAVAVAGQVEAGRLFAFGDPSAFINLMMRYPGNRRFATGLVQYLVAGDRPGPAGGRLFICVNDFDERGGFGGVTPWRKSIDRTLQSVLEGLGSLRREGLPPWLRPLVAGLVALLVGLWAWSALGRSYRQRVPRFARPTPLLAQGGLAGRIAVLSASTSPTALVLLELRSALGEALALNLDRPPETRASVLVDEAVQRGWLEPEVEREARTVLERMRRAENGVLTGRPARVRRRDVARAARVVQDILSRAGAQVHPSVAMRATMHGSEDRASRGGAEGSSV
jgi:hypothetical protein